MAEENKEKSSSGSQQDPARPAGGAAVVPEAATPSAPANGGVDISGIPSSAAGAAAFPPPAPVSTRRSGGGGGGGRSGNRSTSPHASSSSVLDAVAQASLGQASALVGGWGYQGLSTLLTSHLQLPATAVSSSSSSGAAAAAASSSSASVGATTATEGGTDAVASGTATAAESAPEGSTIASSAATPAAGSGLVPSRSAVNAAATKSVADVPPWVHWSKSDMAAQMRVVGDSYRLKLTQSALRGYRMARASHGVSRGCYYYECLFLDGPSASDILSNLPSTARLGPGLEEQLARRIEWEKQQQQQKKQEENVAPDSSAGEGSDEQQAPTDPMVDESERSASAGGRGRKRKHAVDDNSPSRIIPRVGGHLRLGWSMRTGDLQAPVGYDKWSYAIRDIGGSIVHKSQRQDSWGGEGFEPGDVIGCAICLYGNDDVAKNHIRFFKNGQCLGRFFMTKGKREGGEAFTELEPGVYYPAVSSYMGGTVQANFGPHWVYPPKKLPPGLKLQPCSDLCKPPESPEQAVRTCSPAVKLFRKQEHQNALKEAIEEEARVQCQAYSKFMKWHVGQIKKARAERGLSVADLPEEEKSDAVAEAAEDEDVTMEDAVKKE